MMESEKRRKKMKGLKEAYGARLYYSLVFFVLMISLSVFFHILSIILAIIG